MNHILTIIPLLMYLWSMYIYGQLYNMVFRNHGRNLTYKYKPAHPCVFRNPARIFFGCLIALCLQVSPLSWLFSGISLINGCQSSSQHLPFFVMKSQRFRPGFTMVFLMGVGWLFSSLQCHFGAEIERSAARSLNDQQRIRP